MYQCINVSGYVGLFDIKESSAEYEIDAKLALSLIERNENRDIPLVISHIDYKVDLTVGHITDIEIDNNGLYCKAVIDNCDFINMQSLINNVFITYFTDAAPSPFLFLKSCFPSFSLSHNRKTRFIKHVALVSLGARRGTLVEYDSNTISEPKSYTNTKDDIYALLVCYARESIKCTEERSELLLKDALICGENDIDFITAGKTLTKKSIKTNINGTSIRKHSDMSDINQEVLGYLGKIASVISEGKGVKRQIENPDQPCLKRSRQDPVLNASQTLASGSGQKPNGGLRDEMNEFKNEMKELFMMQSNTFKDIMKQQMDNSSFIANGPACMYNVPPQEYAYKFGYNRPFNFNYNLPPNTSQQTFQSTNETNSPNVSCNANACNSLRTSDNAKQTLNTVNLSEPTEPHQNVISSNTKIPLEEQQSEEQQDSYNNDSSEELLIEAGLDVNKSEHLINELFKQFLQKFTVKKT